MVNQDSTDEVKTLKEILGNMEEEKRNRIINSAIDEFAKLPYDKASTNNIVKNAGISKGLLFHYFGNKQDLYEKLTEFVLRTLLEQITAQIDWDETDIFERIKQIVIFKIKLGQQYPKMFDFVLNMLSDSRAKSVEEIMAIYEKYGVNVGSLLNDVYTKNIDFTKFTDQKSIDKSINIIRWTLEKYAEENFMMVTDLEDFDFTQAAEAIDVYIDVLKKAFY